MSAAGLSARRHGAVLRAFFALPLPDALQAPVSTLVEALRARDNGASVRWVQPGNHHLTLRFLGNVARELVPELSDAVTDELRDAKPFDIELGAPAPFPSASKPRLVVLDCAPLALIQALAERIERALESFGFEAEKRSFQAHLTLGRLRARRCPALEAPHTAPGPAIARWRADRVLLFQSVLEAAGPRYTPLATIPLVSAMSVATDNQPTLRMEKD